jgi:isoleucyl-tRNA synthetase
MATTKTKGFAENQLHNLSELDRVILQDWKEKGIFEKSIRNRDGKTPFVFYEGPPSANGMPGIHHVIARTIKDIFCRYKTLKGYQVNRKAGWDTHGLPIELAVEKELGITKEDIGDKLSVEDYNKACRTTVMRYTDRWNEVTERMGYWVDMQDPYVTYHNEYIESCWWLLGQLHAKDLLYKGYTIQPYSPAAGTGLSSHELNQPGTYRPVKDTTIVAQFKAIQDAKSAWLFEGAVGDVFFLAWTTTPWTLPSNTALAVGKGITYQQVNTTNPYTGEPVSVIAAKALIPGIMGVKGALGDGPAKGKVGGKDIEVQAVREFTGADIEGIRYEQLMPYVQPEGDAFRVIIGDFVTTEDGAGIVHIAPTFGADDFRVAKQNNVPAIMVPFPDGSLGPLVDKRGRFVPEMGEFAGKYVKNYTDEDESDPNYRSTDVLISIKLKEENRAFKVEKYEHDYPHCWRTDKPVLYYPLDSWFIRTTAAKDRLIELNKTINWKPASTGTGRFGNWLENLVDWNLSRSRFWGIPLPIWMSEDRTEQKCISSRAQLAAEAEKAIAAGFMTRADWDDFSQRDDMHRPYVDRVVLVSDSGQPMRRETDIIDVWFDSGSMPYAQWHYPFSPSPVAQGDDPVLGKGWGGVFPADFIAEGVDQTRGWFFTLHAIGVLVFDSIAFKNVISNGLVLDKNGQKLSKRLGNSIDPDLMMNKYGADAVRWYMVGNAAPWDNLKFNEDILGRETRSFFGTLFNTYFFFAQYANVDGFTYAGTRIPLGERRELDRWVLSRLNSTVQLVDEVLADYEPHRGIKAIEDFLEDLSNWYVRLSRRVFWKGEMTREKEAAYQTLYECLLTMSKLMASYAPFYSDRLYRDLDAATGLEGLESVHLADFPHVEPGSIDLDLEQRMAFAREITSLAHSIRKNPAVGIKVRQPLPRILVPVLSTQMKDQVEAMRDLILAETNVKALVTVSGDEPNAVIVKKAKPNFKALGIKLGRHLKEAAAQIELFGADQINALLRDGRLTIVVDGAPCELTMEEVEVRTQDMPGWQIASNDKVTVALDLELDDALRAEGLAREVVNRIQGIRKDIGLEVTDRIRVQLLDLPQWTEAVKQNLDYICSETLAVQFDIVPALAEGHTIEIDGAEGKLFIGKDHVR